MEEVVFAVLDLLGLGEELSVADEFAGGVEHGVLAGAAQVGGLELEDWVFVDDSLQVEEVVVLFGGAVDEVAQFEGAEGALAALFVEDAHNTMTSLETGGRCILVVWV